MTTLMRGARMTLTEPDGLAVLGDRS
jgi:hypothetical protein